MRRDDLHSPVSSPRSSPDPEFAELLRSRAQGEFTFTTTNFPEVRSIDQTLEDEDEEAELVLFAAPTSGAAPQTHKIRLQSPDEGSGDPGFAVTRPRSYYIADEVDSEREAEYQAIAVDADTIMAMSKEPWPGCALPWKVRTISAHGIKKAILVGHPKMLVNVGEETKGRTRKSKKTRIALRKKTRAAESRKAEEERLKKEQEETEREKRTKRNREKKVKKKAREKAKKLADSGVAEADGGEVEKMDDEDSAVQAA